MINELINISDDVYMKIVTAMRTCVNVDISRYQPVITKHRFARFAFNKGYRTIESAIEQLKSNKQFAETFTYAIKVPTTEMFRDPQTWQEIENILNQKKDQESIIKIWVPDICGDDELNSLLILLSKNGIINKSLIYATSPYQMVLNDSSSGIIDIKKFEISDANFKRMDSNNNLLDYVSKEDRYLKFSPELLSKTIFIRQSMIMNPPPDLGFNLVLFRNRALYYNGLTRKHSFEKLTQCIQSGGYLIIGTCESLNGIEQAPQYTQISKTENIFRKK